MIAPLLYALRVAAIVYLGGKPPVHHSSAEISIGTTSVYFGAPIEHPRANSRPTYWRAIMRTAEELDVTHHHVRGVFAGRGAGSRVAPVLKRELSYLGIEWDYETAAKLTRSNREAKLQQQRREAAARASDIAFQSFANPPEDHAWRRENADFFHGAYSRIAKQLGVSRSSVSRTARGLKTSHRISAALDRERIVHPVPAGEKEQLQ